MPVQITPFKGSNLAQIALAGEGIKNQREGLRLRDVALGQRQQNIDNVQSRFEQQSARLDDNQKLEAAQALPIAMLEAAEYASQLPEGRRLPAYQQQIGPLLAEAERQGIAPQELLDGFRQTNEGHLEPRRVQEKLKQIFETQDGGLVGVTESGNSRNIDLGGAKVGDVPSDFEREKQALELETLRLKAQKEKDAIKSTEDQEGMAAVQRERASEDVRDILAPDNIETFNAVYGKFDAAIPEVLRKQSVVDMRATVEGLEDWIAIEERAKLKGQGTITDTETDMLKRAVSRLTNFNMSERMARKEFKTVARIMGLDISGVESTESSSTGEPLNPVIDARPGGKGQGKIMVDANGNRARVFEDGSFEEL